LAIARRIKFLVAGVAIATLGVAAFLIMVRMRGRDFFRKPANSWNAAAVKGSYAGVQVREIDAKNAAIVFFFDLENGTDLDYRLDNGPNLVILGRLKSDGSLSSEKPIRLNHAVFVPTKNRTRIGLEIVEPFGWPDRTDAAAENKFREFVAQEVANLAGFVLFDQGTRYQIELPGMWSELQQIPTSATPP
jgi:hypothetical protein